MAQSELTLRLSSSKLLKLQPTETSLIVAKISSKVEISHRQILSAEFDSSARVLRLSYIRKRRRRTPYSLITVEGEVLDAEDRTVQKWTDALMYNSYEGAGIKRGRKFKVIVNPHGGVGKGVAIYNHVVEPILKAAGCEVTVTQTTHSGHAFEIARSLATDYDALITVSGDGLVHEVMNGFANHEDPLKVFTIPIAPIPTGSGNGLSLNILGIEHGFDIAVAALNAVKGRPMKVDVFSVTQGGKRTISFMSQAIGLMADLDIGTEHLRWLGDTRFLVGLAQGLMKHKPCPVQLSYKAVETDKIKMAESLHAWRKKAQESPSPPPSPVPFPNEQSTSTLPPTRHMDDDEEGWTTLNEPLLYVYAGKGPYVGRDLMAFPVSLPNDGLIDIVAMPLSTRKNAVASIPNAAEGDLYWRPEVQYIKAHAYRVRPLTNKGILSVDGEHFPFEEFHVETHRELASFLSPYGYYAAEFHPTPKQKKPKKQSRSFFRKGH
ncbi:hypothetical protein BDN72DRAFT_830967 [Pluteus cervinus]|uniref:Uncharacterized protein n=1 Tax=Pluteus cervinus TaxID=181527 RepID=A0ACD3BEV2_9AGAR|nr:hypothetical protein BDN72DRAFT_830967 [Pluteus cervinus]